MKPQDVRKAIADIIGNRLRAPRIVSLGFENTDGSRILKVEGTETDAVGKYHIHEMPGRQAFSGEAYLKPGQLPESMIRYGTPVRVEYDPLYDEWVITGPDPMLTNEYLLNVDLSQQDSIGLAYFQPGLLDQTTPPSMITTVYGAPYMYDGKFNWWETQQTKDFTGDSEIPTVNDTARFVLVQLNATDGTLDYKYATDTFNARLTNQQAKNLIDDGTGNVVPDKDSGYWQVGYLRLIYGMTSFQRNVNIWPTQSVFTLGSGGVATVLYDEYGVPLWEDGKQIVEE